MEQKADIQDPILMIGCIILGAMAGGLIAFPVATQTLSTSGPIMLGAGTILGGLIGYRRRNSRPFLYFSLFVVLTLLTLVLFNMS